MKIKEQYLQGKRMDDINDDMIKKYYGVYYQIRQLLGILILIIFGIFFFCIGYFLK